MNPYNPEKCLLKKRRKFQLALNANTYDDFTVVSLANDGTERWTYRYNGPGNFHDGVWSVVYGLDGNVYAGGESYGNGTASDLTLISLNASGNERWVYRYNGTGNNSDYIRSVIYGSDNYIYIAGEIYGSNSYADFTVIGLDPAFGLMEHQGNVKSKAEFTLLTNFFNNNISITFTNPGNLSLKISMYNVLGVIVYENLFPTTPSLLCLKEKTISQLPKGVYFLSVIQGKETYSTIKLIKF